MLPVGPFEAVAATSAQALQHAQLNSVLHLPLYAVGETTAAAGRAAGFENVRIACGSASSIAALIREGAPQASRILYICGKVRRPELESALAHAGFQVTAAETYDAIVIEYSESELGSILGAVNLDAVTLMSAQAAALFSLIVKGGECASLFKSAEMICFSQRIADELAIQGARRVAVTKQATEEALLDCLSQRFLND